MCWRVTGARGGRGDWMRRLEWWLCAKERILLYGYSENREERNITPGIGSIRFVSAKCKNGDVGNRESQNNLPKMQDKSKSDDKGFVR